MTSIDTDKNQLDLFQLFRITILSIRFVLILRITLIMKV